MPGKQLLLGFIGFSAGLTVAAGLFSFIISLGVISDFADRTHTGRHVLFYETCVAVGGSLGNIFMIYRIPLELGYVPLALFGLLAGIFSGCWAMALAEILNMFPILIRRIRLIKCIPYIIVSLAIGRGLGALLFFWSRW